MNRITAVVAGLLLAFVGTSESFADSNFHFVGLWGDDTNGHGTQEDPWRTIKHAISQCNNADYICLMDSYPAAYEEHNIQILDKKVFIQSCNGDREKVIIDGGGHARVFYINGSATNGTSIRDLTIKNGHTIGDAFDPQWYGGGIWCNSNIAVSNCKIMDCHAYTGGGGIYCTGNSSPTITNCSITNNVAESYGWLGAGGGGIYCQTSSPTIKNCNISGNTANATDQQYTGGGGINCFLNSSPTITNCTITNNTTGTNDTTGNWGGGIYCYYSNPTIKNCNISGNTADKYGGGIFCYESNPTIKECMISDNEASVHGGGICCFNDNPPPPPTIIGGSICGNHPDQHYGCHPWSAPGTTIAPTCPKPPGDMDGDGDVDADDVHLVEHEAGICHHDTNGDGITNIIDVLEVIIGWGASCAP